MAELTYEQDADRVRALAQRLVPGADCIHFAPNWRPRADALYAVLTSVRDAQKLWAKDWLQVPDEDTIFLLPGGRMVVADRVIQAWHIEQVRS